MLLLCRDRLRLIEALRKADSKLVQVGWRKSDLNGWLHVHVRAGQQLHDVRVRRLVFVNGGLLMLRVTLTSLRGVKAPFRVVNHKRLHRDLLCLLENTCARLSEEAQIRHCRLHRLSINFQRLKLVVVDLSRGSCRLD